MARVKQKFIKYVIWGLFWIFEEKGMRFGVIYLEGFAFVVYVERRGCV